jgi:hypothetical protein
MLTHGTVPYPAAPGVGAAAKVAGTWHDRPHRCLPEVLEVAMVAFPRSVMALAAWNPARCSLRLSATTSAK